LRLCVEDATLWTMSPILHPTIRAALIDRLEERRLVDTRPPRRARSLRARRRRVSR
jgi:hypothetical protein